jgi:O-antigen/teichoic acid export membrane protein
MLVALVLPPLLVHRMTPPEYSAWVLILQCSAYVNLLDLGLQAAISKYVAEFNAAGDRAACGRILSSSFMVLCICASIGVVVIAIVTWKVPELFVQMPPALIGNLRMGILVVGLSAVLALPFGAFLAAFTGLQNYGFPTVLAMSSKILSTALLAGLLLMHGTLMQLVWVIAAFNLVTALGQVVGWRRFAKERVGFSFTMVDSAWAWRLVKYGSTFSIWTAAMLFVSGLDVVIVGHFDYHNTGYYGIATAATNFMLALIGSLFSPLIPAVSSLQSERTPGQIGEMAVKATRYCALLICFTGLPFLFGAYPILKLWVGGNYASHSALFLEVLVLGNGIRMLGYPYALIVLATGQQYLATFAAVAEAAVNISVSIYLAQRVGAVGVAIGTLVGAFVSVGVHIVVTMKLTRATALISRPHLLLEGLLRPVSCLIPSLFLLPYWKTATMLAASPLWIATWFLATLAIAWFIGLRSRERQGLKVVFSRLVY